MFRANMRKLKYLKVLIIGTMVFGSGVIVAQKSPEQPDTGMSIEEFEEAVTNLPLFSEVIRSWKQKAREGNIARQ